jgi:hypothetical protein
VDAVNGRTARNGSTGTTLTTTSHLHLSPSLLVPGTPLPAGPKSGGTFPGPPRFFVSRGSFAALSLRPLKARRDGRRSPIRRRR